MASLTDAFHKLARGRVHLTDFYEQLRTVFDENRANIEVNHSPYPKPAGTVDPRAWIEYTVAISEVPVITKEMGLILGEAIQCFRTSLDYLAWAFVQKHKRKRLSEKQKRFVSFPMAKSRRVFWIRIDDWLPDVPREQRSFVEEYQPYRRSIVGRDIRFLRNLSNVDKHRIIIPTFITPEEIGVQFFFPPGTLIQNTRLYKEGRQIKKGTKLTSYVLAGVMPGTGQARVESNLILIPTLPRDIAQPPPPFQTTLLQPALDGFATTCEEILTRATDYF